MSLNETISNLGESIVNLVDKKVASAGVYFENVTALKAVTNLSSGQVVATKGYYTPNDGGSATYLIRLKQDKDVDDGGSIHFLSDNTLVAELMVKDGVVNVKQFGCIADANYYDSETGKWYTSSSKTSLSTDNYTNLMNTFNYARNNKYSVKVEGDFNSNSDITLNNLTNTSIYGKGGILGCTFKIQAVKHLITKDTLKFDTLYISGMWHSVVDKINVANNLIIDGYHGTWGTLWNKFNSLRITGKINIDCDHGSINQNLFEDIKASGGLHIYGTNTTGARECHQNIFDSIDTTGANITDKNGVTGIHILNESQLNQLNIIKNWYAEVSGAKTIRGNWHVIASLVDSGSTSFAGEIFNSYFLGSGLRNTGGYLAAPDNQHISGDFSHLTDKGLPVNVNFRQLSKEVIGVDDAPDGNPIAVLCKHTTQNTQTFTNIQFLYPLTSKNLVTITAYVKIKNLPRVTTSLLWGDTYAQGTSFQSALNCTLTPVNNGWYILRGSASNVDTLVSSRKSTVGDIVLFFVKNATSLTEDIEVILGSFYISTGAISFLPHFKEGRKEATGAACPSAGIWFTGDTCYNSAPAVGSPYGWVCTQSGDYRTLQNVTGTIDENTDSLLVNDPSLLYAGASIDIDGIDTPQIIKYVDRPTNTVTLSKKVTTAVTDANITFTTPLWANLGNLS